MIPEKWRKTAAWAALALLAAALLFNAFAGLGAAEIRNWDEARHAISAWEMLNGGICWSIPSASSRITGT